MSAPTWLQLRAIGNSTAARMTLLIPVLGILLMFSEALETVYTLSERLMGIDAEQAKVLSRWNLHLLYFGLVGVALATALYKAFCPEEIKTFATDYEFHDSELKLMTEKRANALIDKINKKFGGSREPFNGTPNRLRSENVECNRNQGSREYWLQQNSEYVSDLLQEKYNLENTSLASWRRAIQVIWIVSFIILSIPSLATLAKICFALYSSMA